MTARGASPLTSPSRTATEPVRVPDETDGSSSAAQDWVVSLVPAALALVAMLVAVVLS